MCNVFNASDSILSYQSTIWASCDVVRGHVKESDLPNLMMPFFALIMTESRLVRQYQLKKAELEGQQVDGDLTLSFKDGVDEDLHKDVVAEIRDQGKGYNSVILDQKTRLIDICRSSVNFEADLEHYLDAFDEETQTLLGVHRNKVGAFLNIRGQIEFLKEDNNLFDFVSAWAKIDLTNFTNSDITTLEEHIKRRWADISAQTSGEQYTPDDIIGLIGDLSLSYVKQGATFSRQLNLYDMTCGGGNMLYGVEDQIKPLLPEHSIYSYGQEMNKQLYALAKIESRFRDHGRIELGDTLVDDKLYDVDMDLLVANPPYGVDWKKQKRDVENDTFGRYIGYPSTSDGQLLFVQHAISKLKDTGKAIIVLNGSPMFSGDVNSGEAQIRKWLLDNDYVEAWIQLPKSEFFNTQITTYLWVLNKDKPAERKDKILLINAENQFQKLKKAKGSKTNEMGVEHRQWVVDAFANFGADDENVKVLSKYEFYYNKKQLSLIETNDDKESVFEHFPKGKKVIPTAVSINGKEINFDGYTADADGLDKAKADVACLVSDSVMVTYSEKKVDYNAVQLAGEHVSSVVLNGSGLGAGRVEIKVTLQKQTAKSDACLKWTAEIKPIVTKDYEIIPYSPDENDNATNIQSFIDQWVRKHYVLGENSVAVEVNFNKIFYKPVVLRSTKEIAAEIKALDVDLVGLEKELWG